MSRAIADAEREPVSPPARDARGMHGGPGAESTLALYRQWFQTASDPEHSAALSAQFLDCWNAALRFRRVADGAALA
jgi:hypothetical protein